MFSFIEGWTSVFRIQCILLFIILQYFYYRSKCICTNMESDKAKKSQVVSDNHI